MKDDEMKKLSIFVCLITSLLLMENVSAGNVSSSSPTTGNQLLAVCVGNDTYKSCVMYIVGFVDGLNYSQTLSNQHLICIPEGVTPIQLALIVVNYLTTNPKDLHELATLSVWASLFNSYRC